MDGVIDYPAHCAGEPFNHVQRCRDCGKVLMDITREYGWQQAERRAENDPRRLKIPAFWPPGTLVICERVIPSVDGIASERQAMNPCT